MSTVFTKIIDGVFPGRFVWRDDVCVAFLSINPLAPGHTLVVPIAEVDHWLDLDEATTAHLMTISHRIGVAQQAAFSPARVGMVIAGFEVPHTHLHVVPMAGMENLDFRNAALDPDSSAMDAAQAAITQQLRDAGYATGV